MDSTISQCLDTQRMLIWESDVLILLIKNSPFFYIPADIYSYFSVGEVVQDTSLLYYEPNVVFKFKVILDSKYQTINRQVYSLGDMFGQIGGMDSMLLTIGTIFMKILASKIYTASLIHWCAKKMAPVHKKMTPVAKKWHLLQKNVTPSKK